MAERKRTRLCGTCRFKQATGNYINGIELVECRRRAPLPSDGPLGTQYSRGRRAYWPLISAEEWCGEWGEV